MELVNGQYERLLEDVLFHGEPRQDRTGVGTREVFPFPRLRLRRRPSIDASGAPVAV